MSFTPPELVPLLPPHWQPKLTLYEEDVWNAFYIHGLLLDHTSHSTTLQIPNKASSQANRLRPALEARNCLMSGPGQVEWNHACEKCTYIFPGADGKLRKCSSNCSYHRLTYNLQVAYGQSSLMASRLGIHAVPAHFIAPTPYLTTTPCTVMTMNT
jgi:hypothetical protein